MSEEINKEETNPESTDAKATEESKPKSNLMKYIIFGVGGLVLISGIAFGVAFMLKESPKADAEETSEVSEKSHDKKASDEHADDSHASKDVKDDYTSEETYDADSYEDNPELSMEDFNDAELDEDEFDSKAIEKIVANLALLEYTPSDSELAEEDGMSLADSLEQMSWIEREKLEIASRKKDLDAREKELNNLEKTVDSKLIRIEQAESSRTSQLAKLYDSMDSRAVAKLMMNLDDETVVTLLPRMKSKNAALVLQLLPSKRAAVLSKKMITIAGN